MKPAMMIVLQKMSHRQHSWNTSDILHFTLIMGAISSLFDAAMFLILVKGFHADETLFQTGWFLESIATQILVVFLIRSSRLPWRTTRPNAVLAVTSLGPLAAAIFVVAGPYRTWFGFTDLTWPIAAVIAGVTVCYLIVAEAGKHLALAASKHAAATPRAARR